jgi:hypothetical protein
MTFAFELPLALIGLGALLLPIAVHALARRTPRDFTLPTLRFLDAAPKARRALSFPQDRFILLLRALALACFALAAARPFIPAGGGPETLVAILDDSLSMAHGGPQGPTRFERARAALEEQLQELPEDARAALVLASRPRATLGSKAAALEALRQAAPRAGSSSLVPALACAAGLVARDPLGRVLVASDLDRPALEGLERQPGLLAEVRLETIDVGDPPRDASLGAVSIAPCPAIAGEPVTVTARLQATGLGEGPFPVALEVNGAEVARREVRPGEEARFVLPRAKGDWVSGALVVKAPGDALALDDRRFFAAPVLREVPLVLLGRDSAERGANAREQPLSDALAALALARGMKIQVATVPESTLPAALDHASVLLLASPSELGEATRRAIAAFVAKGGGVLAFLDESVPETTLRWLSERAGFPATARGLGAGRAAPLHVEREEAFEPALARALAALELEPQAALVPGLSADVLVAAGMGEALWVEHERTVVLGFAPWGRNEGLVREAGFPLIVGRALQAALGTREAPSLTAGEPVDLAALGRLTGESEETLRRATFEPVSFGGVGVSPAPSAGGRDARPTEADEAATPGLYAVHDGSRLLALLPVNASERESLLERSGESARSLLAGSQPGREGAAGALELAVPVVAAGLVLLLVSSVVANRGLLSIARARPAGVGIGART